MALGTDINKFSIIQINEEFHVQFNFELSYQPILMNTINNCVNTSKSGLAKVLGSEAFGGYF